VSDIVKYDSLSFDDIRRDVENFLTLSGEIDPADFNASSTLRRFSDGLAAICDQIYAQLNNIRKESIMDSAIRPESIRYLAMSQLSYNPKRRIAPQHPNGEYVEFYKPDDNAALDPRGVVGNIEIDGTSYPISFLNGYAPIKTVNYMDAANSHRQMQRTMYRGRICIGTWKSKTFDLDTIMNYKTPYFNFRVEDDRDSIDDSGTVAVSFRDNESERFLRAVDNLADVMLYRDDEKRDVVLVKNSFFGGLDINFGDGIIFGNALYVEPSKVSKTNEFTVFYLSTPGFIPNFKFDLDKVTWDSGFIADDAVETDEGPRDFTPRCSLKVANGINAETPQQIKTLSPYAAMANQRIMTNDDFIARVQRIPNVKSAYSMPRHLEPDEPGAVSELVPTATFMLSGLTLRAVFPWTAAQSFKTGESFPVGRNNESDRDRKARLDAVRGFLARWSDIENLRYAEDDVVIHNGKLYRLPKKDGGTDFRESFWNARNDWAVKTESEVDLTDYGWKPATVDEAPEYQALTQIEWDLNFHQQYNFDKLLGFMRVMVTPPERYRYEEKDGSGKVTDFWDGEFDLDVQLSPYVKGNLTPSEINDEIRRIIFGYCWTLGAFLDVGELVCRINEISGVKKCYLRTPVKNRQLSYCQYIKPTVNITYATDTVKAARFGK